MRRRAPGAVLAAGTLAACAAVARLGAAPVVLSAADVAGEAGAWVRYTRAAGGARVLLIPDVDLEGVRSLELVLESEVPTQLKLYAILPGGATRMRYLVLSPLALERRVRLSLEAFDPEPSARWTKVPEGGALLVADVPHLRMVAPRGRLRVAGLALSPEPRPLPPEMTPPEEDADPVLERIHAAWLGKALGGRAGMAGEGRGSPDWEALEGSGWEDLVPVDGHGFGPDDDTTLGVASLLLAERLGRPPRGAEILMEWMSRVSPEFQWKNGWEVLRRFRRGLRPPETGEGPLGEFLDARIRITPWGLLRAGDPAGADALAVTDAGVSSSGAGVDDARFVARALAGAFEAPGLEALVEASLEGLGEAYREAVRWGFRARAEGRSLRQAYRGARERFHDPLVPRFGEDAWVHSLPNAALLGLALAYGDGDPVRTLRLAAHLGWDADCNAGTVGALMGAWKGAAAFPAGFRESLGDRLRVGVAGKEHWSVRRLAARTWELRRRWGGDGGGRRGR